MSNLSNLSKRQQKILSILEKNPQGLSRSKLQKNFKTISKITLIRDLHQLLGQKHINKKGGGRSLKYYPIPLHPLLTPININQYFNQKPDQRTPIKSFNFKVFNHLKNLLTTQEKIDLDLLNQQYQKRLKPVDKTSYKKELERLIIELSWKSSQIEGNTYSLLETEVLIKQHRPAKNHPEKEAQMILNHKSAFDVIVKHQKSFKNMSLTDIYNIHALLVKDLDIPKNFRNTPVGITGTQYTPLKLRIQIKQVLEKTIKVVNQTKHPVEKALITTAMLSYIQPFIDANKRTSRIASNALLLSHRYIPLSYRNIDELEYKKTIVLFYETNNLYHFKKMFISQFKFAIKTYFN